MEDFSKVLELSPSDDKALYNRGTAYIKLEEYDKAKLDFNKALKINPKYYKALINRGICLVFLDDISGAK